VKSSEVILWEAMAQDATLEDLIMEGRDAEDPQRVPYLRGYRDALAWVLGWQKDPDTDVRSFLAVADMEVSARGLGKRDDT
jgi:hypothetical protein